MKFAKSMKLWLRSVLLNLGKVETDKGDLYWDGDQILRVSDAVYKEEESENEDPNYIPAEDGEYTAEDGRVIVVKDGIVVEIKEGTEPQPDGEPAPAMEEEQPAEDAEPAGADIEAKIAELEAKIAELEARIAALEVAPADDPADESEKLENSRVDALARLAKIRRK